LIFKAFQNGRPNLPFREGAERLDLVAENEDLPETARELRDMLASSIAASMQRRSPSCWYGGLVWAELRCALQRMGCASFELCERASVLIYAVSL
jgi:hypothetical protein